MTKEELIGLVEKIMNAEYSSEEEGEAWIKMLEENVADPNVTNLIFYPEEEMTAEEIVNKALAYKSITLP